MRRLKIRMRGMRCCRIRISSLYFPRRL